MMKKIYLLFAILTICITSFAQNDYKPIGNKSVFVEQYRKASGEITNLQCNFEQIKEITLLDNKLKAYGIMYFRNDNKLKIEYTKPNKFVFILNNSKITMKDGQNASSSVSLKSNKLFQQISQVTMNAIDGNLFDAKNFNFTVLENSGNYLVKAIPASKELKQYYTELQLHISKKTWLMERIVMLEASGDVTTMFFKDVDVKSKIGDEVFTIH